MSEGPKRVKSRRETGPGLSQDPKRLRRRRIAAGMSQAALAAKAGCSAPYLCQLEKGDYSASAEILAALAGALECKITDLMTPERVAA